MSMTGIALVFSSIMLVTFPYRTKCEPCIRIPICPLSFLSTRRFCLCTSWSFFEDVSCGRDRVWPLLNRLLNLLVCGLFEAHTARWPFESKRCNPFWRLCSSKSGYTVSCWKFYRISDTIHSNKVLWLHFSKRASWFPSIPWFWVSGGSENLNLLSLRMPEEITSNVGNDVNHNRIQIVFNLWYHSGGVFFLFCTNPIILHWAIIGDTFFVTKKSQYRC